MSYDPERHHRRTIRLPEYEYAWGAYFVTMCTHERQCLFGGIVGEQMVLSQIGVIVEEEWQKSAEIRAEIVLDEWVVMPNHVHGIVIITEQGREDRHIGISNSDRGATPRAPTGRGMGNRPESLSSFVGGFKTGTTARVDQLRGVQGIPVWQRNYYERVIRNERELDAIREYIVLNPLRWAMDEENPR
jgi:REP element-mobilizing transposase RayT